MKRRFNIVVAGAGVAGLALAALLRRSPESEQFDITIVDAAARPQPPAGKLLGLRVSAISAGSTSILERAGAWDRIDLARICRYEDMRVWDESGAVEGPETLLFSAAEHALPELGHIIENKQLQVALLDSLTSQQQAVEFGVNIRSVDRTDEGIDVTLSDGRTLHSDLLVAADGGSSFVRRQAGFPVRSWSYAQRAFVTHLEAEQPHRHTAWQRFLADGPIALLPLPGKQVSVVWSTTPETVRECESLDDTALGQRLTDATDGVLGKLSPVAPRGSFPLRAQYATEYVQQGIVLIGDAAHSVHPLAGQGANLGVADASALAQVLTSSVENNEVISDFRVLRRYERERSGANKTMLMFIDSLNRLFTRRDAAVNAIRGSGMRIFNRSGPLRELAVRVALGLDGHAA